MEKEIDLSFIIPVYNVENYLEKCIESVIEIKKNNSILIECILIDDGSTDKSKEISDFYSFNYEWIYTYHIKNAGVSNARNIGLIKSVGKYVTFIDSDDYINCIDLSFINSNEDLYCLDYSFDSEKKIKKKIFKNYGLYKNIIKYPVYMNSVWNKFYKKEIIEKNNILFDKKLYASEDLLFNLQYINICNGIKYIDQNYYNYRINDNSLTRKKERENTIKNNICARAKCVEVCQNSVKLNNNKLIGFLKIESIIPYLIDIDNFNPFEYRKYNYKEMWVFNYRFDYFILTFCAIHNIDLMLNLYINIKKIIRRNR